MVEIIMKSFILCQLPFDKKSIKEISSESTLSTYILIVKSISDIMPYATLLNHCLDLIGLILLNAIRKMRP